MPQSENSDTPRLPGIAVFLGPIGVLFLAAVATQPVFMGDLPPWLPVGVLIGAAAGAATINISMLKRVRAIVEYLRSERDSALLRHRRRLDELASADAAVSKARSAVERAEARAAASSRFLATLSHAARTPLTGVIGMADLLSETPLDDEQSALVSTVLQSARSLETLVSNVLLFSRLEMGDLELDDVPYDIGEVAERVVSDHAGAARNKGLEIVLDAAPDLFTKVRGDSARVAQIMSILIDNAIKFTERGEIVLRVSARDRSGASEMTIEIEDTGCGIARDDIGRVFAPFVQVNREAAERYGGTGLGLSIAKRLARLMGGRIDARSTVGEGSVFSFQFALRQRAMARDAEAPRIDLSGCTFLVVDDSDAARRTLVRQIEAWGGKAVIAASTEEAEDAVWTLMAQGESIDAAFIDATLPDGDGAVLGRRLLELGMRRFPIVAMSALEAHYELPREGDNQEGHFVARIPKPLLKAPLLDTLREISSLSGVMQQAPPVEMQPPAPGSREPLMPACIILADDNATNRILIEKFLADESMTLIHVPDGVGAVEAFRDWAPDLILMDVSMPRMDGLEATRSIRAMERTQPGTRVPIIALTARALSEDREACLAAGMDDYVTKPIRKAELKSKIEEWTRSRHRNIKRLA